VIFWDICFESPKSEIFRINVSVPGGRWRMMLSGFKSLSVGNIKREERQWWSKGRRNGSHTDA
jgi:hypothetical protein